MARLLATALLAVALLMLVLLPGAAAAAASAAPEPRVRFDGHQVLRVYASRAVVEQLEARFAYLDVWRYGGEQQGTDVRVEPHRRAEVAAWLAAAGARFHVMVEDVQALIDVENVVAAPAGANGTQQQNDSFYSSYHDYTETAAWINSLPAKYPGLASVISIGRTYEGRELLVVKISRGAPRAAIWLDSLLHSREWISGGVVNYIAGSLLDQYGKNEDTTRLVDNIDWYILPVFNADGVDYTRTNRMWRKTRTPNQGSSCIGTDPNRNWLFEWGGCGTSRDPCSDSYQGSAPFSEPCLIGVSDFLYDLQQKTGLLKAYINFHAYSQLWMSPWGWTTNLPTDFPAQDALGAKAVAAIRAVHGTSYDHGSISRIIYCASGSSADWTYGNLSIKYSYGVELRDQGQYGFLLPANQIIPSGEETFAAVKVLGEQVLSEL